MSTSSSKLPRSRTVNEGIKQAADSASDTAPMSSTPPGNARATGSKSMLWGWLGFGSGSGSGGGGSEKSSSTTTTTTTTSSSAAPTTRTRLAVSQSGMTGGSASLRRWASLVSDQGPQGPEEFGRPNTGEPPSAPPDVSTSAPQTSSSSTDSTAEKMSKRQTEVSPKGSLRYVVSDGDTLQSIAVKLNITVGEITKLNRLTTRILFPGQVINVPDPNYVPEPPPPPPPGSATKQASLDGKVVSEDYECVEKFVKGRALYLPNKSLEDGVPGMLLVTPNAVMFDPAQVAALVEQQVRTSEIEEQRTASPSASVKASGSVSSLPPGDLLLPMSWIASVTIFREIPGAPTPRPRIGSSPVQNKSDKTASVTSIGEESESERSMSGTDSAINLNLCSTSPQNSQLPTDNAFDQSSSGQPRANNNNNTSATPQTAGSTLSSTANKAVAAVSESASAITEMSSQIAGAIGTPLKRISLGTLAKVEPAIFQSVETLSLQSGEGDPVGPSSQFLRIIGTSSLNDDSLAALGIGSSTASSVQKSSSSSSGKPEYWFSVPTKCARGLQQFFTLWNPEMAGVHGVQNNSPKSQQANKSRVVGFRPPENASNRSPEESSYKEWEVISIDESVKRNQAEDAEIMRSLPLPDMQGKSTILSDDYIRELYTILPPICIGATWALLYASVSNGFSLSSLFRAATFSDSPQLLVLQDLSGSIFGAVSSCPFRISDHFYGSSECCLFTFFPRFRVFRWSGENNFFIKGNRESLSFGSANGVNGLWVDAELYRGRTQRCGTYGNDLLTTTEDFTIAAVELWGFPSS